MKRRLLIALALAIPLALFLVARNAASWRPHFILTLESVDPITNLQVSPAGRYLVTLTNPGGELATNLYDLQSGQKLARVANDRAVWSRDETRLVILRGSIFRADNWDEPGVALYDLPSGRLSKILKFQIASKPAPDEMFYDGAFVEGDRVFVVVSEFALWRWDVASGALLSRRTYRVRPKATPFGSSWRCQLMADGAQIWRTAGGLSQRIDVASGRVVRSYRPGGDLLPDARFYRASDGQGRSRIYRVSDGKPAFALTSPLPPTLPPLFAPDGKTYGVGDAQNQFQLREFPSGRVLASRHITPAVTWELAGPDALLTLDDHNRVTRWRLR